MVTHPETADDQIGSAKTHAIAFGAWLDNDRTLLILPAISILVGCGLVGRQLWAAFDGGSLLPWSTAVAFHFLVTVFLLFRSPTIRDDATGSPEAERHTVRFQYAWMILLASWLFLYMTMTTRELAGLANPVVRDQPYWAPFLGLFNNLATVAIVMCRVALQPAVTVGSYAASWTRWIFFPIGVLVVELALTFCLDTKEAWVFYTCRTALDAIAWCAGLFSGVTLAMLIGRLAQAITMSSGTTALFYLYAVIQTAWPVVSNRGSSAIAFLSVALVLKTAFFLHAKWIIETRALDGARPERTHTDKLRVTR